MIVILIVGMIVALVATGMRVISPQTLFFPFVLLLAATALYRGTGNKMRTEEVDAERADYLRYLSVVRDNIRAQAAEQRAAAQWSHPEPAALAAVPGSRRQWERDPHDPDFLVVRAGRHYAPLATALRVNDTADEIDLEPVSHSALRSLLDTQRTVRDVPTGIDLTKVSRITVLGDAGRGAGGVARLDRSGRDLARPDGARGGAGRPRPGEPRLVVAEVVAARRHSRPARRGRARPATWRPTPTSWSRCWARRWPTARRSPARPADALRHLLIVVDDPDYDLDASTLAMGRAGVTVVHCSRARRRTASSIRIPERPILRVADGAIERWQTGGWQPYIDTADQLGADDAAHLARRLSRWDSNPTHAGLRSAATRGATFTTLLGIPDASRAGRARAVGAAPARRRVACPDRCHRHR